MNATLKETKELIMDAAIVLFNTKGYDGTGVRDIAKKAKVNPANISYYFKGKQGLLEACLTQFFEGYLSCLEEKVFLLEMAPPDECLKQGLKSILSFQRENHLLTRFVWREVSIDSQISREIIASYLVKEKYLFHLILEQGIKEGIFANLPESLVIIQLKSLLTMPFLQSQYLREVWHTSPQEKYFVEKYMIMIERWIDSTLCSLQETRHFDRKII
ncbi:forespore capture DNA-binding protein RefZ [Bacillus smithii]|uniref:forespore capture DNA-binding protein RefZ n=1 Tax=Bacillus smithii TaxID=1479 RepID=UPI0022E41759|nr:forespore capture DNA-binding protein RefZ [Bacillus smithii]MED0660480.1 forespore capture DNA-binding protein RefZ [Bacillus smithii]